ncbi:MAG: hypothetical protein J0L75_17155 [Spirochaetes bacterium]|nr:hypothetical protein [Spirochaetota bacterium]
MESSHDLERPKSASAAEPLLELAGVGMPAARLHHVSFSVLSGGIHAVLDGPHPARSPLATLISGALGAPEAGEIRVAGAKGPFRSVGDSLRAGIAVVHAPTGIVPHLTVLQNIVLGREPGPAGFLDSLAARREAERVYGRLGATAPLGAPLASLGAFEHLLIQLARALLTRPRLLVLDQWADLLSEAESIRARQMLARLVEPERALLLFTHRVEDVFHVADRITVLRGGRTVATHLTAEVDEETVFLQAAGRGENPGQFAEKLLTGLGVTPREQELIRLLLQGLSNLDIGERLEIAANTVKAHLFSIYRKTGVKNRLELAHLVRHGPEKPSPLP